MRVLSVSFLILALSGCGPAVFSGLGISGKTTNESGAVGSASGAVEQMCADAGMVPKQDSASDDDSASVDDDSVDGVSADGVSSDDDSSDDAACATTSGCVAKKCEPAPQ